MFVLGLLGWQHHNNTEHCGLNSQQINLVLPAQQQLHIQYTLTHFIFQHKECFECCSEPNVRAGKREDR